MRVVVVFALIASVACTGSSRTPEAAVPVLPTPESLPTTLPEIASPDEPPTIVLLPLFEPPASLVPIPSAPLPSAVPTAVPLPSIVVVPITVGIPSAVRLPGTLAIPSGPPPPMATPRPLSTIPPLIRSAAPISTPALPLPTGVPLLPPLPGL